MNTQLLKSKRAERRRFRVRKSIYGTPAKPRLSVHRSNLHITAQLIDDLNGVTLASATSAGKNSGLKHGSNVAAAQAVGRKLAEAAKAKGITQATFDRGAFRFHGRIAALAIAATEAGLLCTDAEKSKAKLAGKPKAEAEAPEKGKGDKKGEGKPKGEGKKEGGEKPKGEKKEKKEGGGEKK